MYYRAQGQHQSNDMLSQYDFNMPIPGNIAMMKMDKMMNSSQHTVGENDSWANSKMLKIDSVRHMPNQNQQQSTALAYGGSSIAGGRGESYGKNFKKENRDYDINLNNFEAFRRAQNGNDNMVAQQNQAKEQGRKDLTYYDSQGRKQSSLLNVLEDSRLSNGASNIRVSNPNMGQKMADDGYHEISKDFNDL